MSQENYLIVGKHDVSFKGRVKSLGVYIDATLSMAKHIDHMSRSVYFEIRRISSTRHRLTTKATAQLMCPLFSVGWTAATLCSLTSTVISCTGCRKFKTTQRRLFSARTDINTLDHCSGHSTGCQSHGSILKIEKNNSPVFSHGTLLPYLSSCLSVYISSRTLPSSSGGEKTLFLVQGGNLRASVTGRTLFRLP